MSQENLERSHNSWASALAWGAGALISLPVIAAGGWIAYSKLFVNHRERLPEALDAERETLQDAQAGRLSFYADRRAEGTPLVLVHSVNAAASAYEMRPLFNVYRQSRPVWALDLPGFGFSARTDRVYTPQLYADALLALLTREVQRPADVVALSLSCEFAARAALAEPQRFRSLTLISPSGFNRPRSGRASQRAGEEGAGAKAHRILANPLWARPLFDLITTRPSIDYFLSQSFVGPTNIGLANYSYASAHQPGAHHAPLYFLSGQLFTPDVRPMIYGQLDIPAHVIHDEDAFVGFDELPGFLEAHANWRATRVTPTLGLPHFERLPDAVTAMDAFWDGC